MASGRILVVDDDPTLSEILALKLSSSGYEVYTASTGKEGLKKAYEKQPDLVVLDVMMPEMDGYQTTAAIRAWSSGVAVAIRLLFDTSAVICAFGASVISAIWIVFGSA